MTVGPFDSVKDAVEYGMQLREKQKRAAWQGEDDRIHVSELKGCARRVIFQRLGIEVTHPQEMENLLMMDVGHAYHQTLQDFLRHAGINIRSDDADAPWEVGNEDLVGHPDCLVVLRSGLTLLDFKSIKDAGFTRLSKPKSDDVLQLNCYMGLLGMKKGILVYVNRNNGRFKEFDVPFDQDLWLECWRLRAPELMEAIQNAKGMGILPSVPLDYTSSSYPCYYSTRDGDQVHCQYWGHCWGPKPLKALGTNQGANPPIAKSTKIPPMISTHARTPGRTREEKPEEGPGTEGAYAV